MGFPADGGSMTPTQRFWWIAAGFIALYCAGGVLGNQLVVGADSVVLLWAPGALSFVLLQHEGRRWWPLVALADLVFSLVGTDVPAVFIAFTMAANVVGALAATAVARAAGYRPGQTFDLATVRTMALAGLALAVASLPFGVCGLLAAGFTDLAGAPGAAAKWLVANLFGVLVIAPALSLLWPRPALSGKPRGAPTVRRKRVERVVWVASLALALLLVATLDANDIRNAHSALALPTIVLIWGALRLPARLMAAGALACGIVLPSVAASSGGALVEPQTTLEALLLLALLITLTLAPLILMGAVGDARRIARETLRRARTDELTGLSNRQGLEHRIAELLADGPADERLVLALLDIDNFKLINDTGGQAAGDAFLRSIGSLLRAVLPDACLLGRLAGDQFLLVLRDAGTDAEATLQAALTALRDYRHADGANLFSASASLGAIAFRRGQSDYPGLLRLADAACATAKEQGGNRLRFATFDTALDVVAERTAAMRWAVRLDEALREGHFQLFCQSIVGLQADGDDGRHLEILLRMIDPQSGEVLPPAQFVAAAEKFNMGPRLDRYVVDRTLTWFERQPQALAQLETCAINLCAASVNDPGFAGFLGERFARSSVPPGKICLEITETSAVRDLNDAQQFIAAARALGCKLALDDFGAGFCSFAYLRRLDVDYFKIDGSFVRDLESSALSLAIVRSIAEIARSIDKQTIAEFVENDAVRLRLAQLGVDFGQGYGIDRPTPIDQYFLRPPAGWGRRAYSNAAGAP
jgi:diguanylate cyclase (GGDEF)-like protein